MESPSVFLSVVIPAYEEEQRIIPTLEKVTAFLAQQPYRAEVIVADDGSLDTTAKLVEAFAQQWQGSPLVRLLRLPHRGKGAAVRDGMLASEGAFRFQCDADLSMPIEEIVKFLPPQLDGAAVAIGSREGPGARRVGEPAYRHLMGRVFNFLVRTVAVGGFDDTQCGFKMYRKDAAEWLFPRQTMEGFGFDVELLFLARRKGLPIVEVPITWYHVDRSKVRPVHDTLAMMREAMTVRINAWRGRYRD